VNSLKIGLERAVQDHKVAVNPAQEIEQRKGNKRTVEPYSSAKLKLHLRELQDRCMFVFFCLYSFRVQEHEKSARLSGLT